MDENGDKQTKSVTDPLIKKLWNIVNKPNNHIVLTKKEIRTTILKAKAVIAQQPVMLDLVPPLVVVGDIHGQYLDLLRIFEKCGNPAQTNYLFLGDYVDRGSQSVNTICLLLLYKIKYPENFFLLRGNHESLLINREYGFYEECKCDYDMAVWKWFNDLFDWFPISAIIDNRILCLHGGISPSLKTISQLRKIKRPCPIPESGLICDLVWSDPNNNCEHFDDNDRGTSYVYGYQSVKTFLDKMQLDLLVRAHQAIYTGYDFPFSPYRNVVTVFSAPNYQGEYGNFGAIMTINQHLVCKFIKFDPLPEKDILAILAQSTCLDNKDNLLKKSELPPTESSVLVP